MYYIETHTTTTNAGIGIEFGCLFIHRQNI